LVRKIIMGLKQYLPHLAVSSLLPISVEAINYVKNGTLEYGDSVPLTVAANVGLTLTGSLILYYVWKCLDVNGKKYSKSYQTIDDEIDG